MTREEITRMAQEAGALQVGFNKTIMQSEYSMFAHELERFASLVAAEKEKQIIDILERLHERHFDTHNYYAYAICVIKGEI